MVTNELAVDPVSLRLGSFAPLPTATPFTVRSGATYQKLLEDMRVWLRDDLIPFLDAQNDELSTILSDGVIALEAQITTALAQQSTTVTTALTTQQQAVNQQLADTLAQLASSNVAISDTVVRALIDKADSSTRVRLNQLFTLSDVTLHALLADSSSHQSLDLIDSRYVIRSYSKRSILTGWFHVRDYGAQGDGVTDDTDAIQRAINDAATNAGTIGTTQRVHLGSGRYIVSPRDMVQSGGNVDGVRCLELLNGVELHGDGAVLVVKDHAYGDGAYFAVVRSKYEGLYNAGIDGIQFDGRRSQQVSSTNAGNILLEARQNVWVRNVKSYESNGNSIMVRGNAYGDVGENIVIADCRVDGANGVGIQASQFDGLLIESNTVQNTNDNCIDVYGESGDHSATPHAINFQVNNNRVRNGLVGIFFETVAYGVAVGNRVSNCRQDGMRVNRINGEPRSIAIRDNGLYGNPTGIAFSGDMKAVSFVGNEVQGATTACMKFDGLRCSGVFGKGNLLNGAATSVPLILVTDYCQQFTRVFIDQTMTESQSSPTFVNYSQSSSASTIANAAGPGF